MVLLAYYLAVKHDIKLLIINGDLIATDQDALKAFVDTWKSGADVTYEGAIATCRALLKTYGTWFA